MLSKSLNRIRLPLRAKSVVACVFGTESELRFGTREFSKAATAPKAAVTVEQFDAQRTKWAADASAQARAQERELRVQLAAAYRLASFFGWEELIYNHITCRLPHTKGESERFLISPYGMGFDEITASSLVTVDVNGTVLDPGSSTGRVNPAGFIIHSAVHEARADAHCVFHCHQEDVVAVSARPEGLVAVGQAYYALGEVTWHDYEGLALLEDEKKTLVRDLGPTSKVMILRNHGCLTLGSSVAEAFIKMFFLVRSCQQQIKAGPSAKPPKDHIQHIATEQALGFNKEGYGLLEFAYLQRKLEKMQGTEYKA